ncbi:MAG: PKD domain-containing protein, partial [Thermoguttaceae bacterium]
SWARWPGGSDFAVVRYNSDGSLDTTFGTGGKVTTDFAFRDDHAAAIAVQADGKIVVAGSSYEGPTDYDFALVRYNSDGSLDASFDGDGKVTTDIGRSGTYDEGSDVVVVQPDGKIIVVGTCFQSYGGGTGNDFALARYNSDGSLDGKFGTGGLVTTDFGSEYDFGYGVAIDAAGKIVVAGYSHQQGTGQDFALARYVVGVGLGPITAPVDPVEVNTEITASATFLDRDVSRTHTALWDWGDGTTSPGTVAESNGSGTVTGNHAYTAPGVYTITLTVEAVVDGTLVDSEQSVFKYVVVFDPSAGFVTGGGWICSPPGAYAPKPYLPDRASFGFVSKYENGAKVPTGQTQFHFRVADLNFHSSEYQWLVVAGAKAQFKGTGTVNGQGDYGFMVTAIDGQVQGGGGRTSSASRSGTRRAARPSMTTRSGPQRTPTQAPCSAAGAS